MRTRRIVLVASLLLNLFLIGAIVGGAAWLHVRRPMILAGSLRIAGAELPRDERIAFRRALRETRRSMRPATQQSRDARREAATLLRRPVPDQTAVNAALARARATDAIVRAAIEERAVAFAATMPAADRASLADAIETRAAGGRHARGR